MRKFFLFVTLAFLVNIAGGLFVHLFDLDKLKGTDLILPVVIFWIVVIGAGLYIRKAYAFLSRSKD